MKAVLEASNVLKSALRWALIEPPSCPGVLVMDRPRGPKRRWAASHWLPKVLGSTPVKPVTLQPAETVPPLVRSSVVAAEPGSDATGVSMTALRSTNTTSW